MIRSPAFEYAGSIVLSCKHQILNKTREPYCSILLIFVLKIVML